MRLVPQPGGRQAMTLSDHLSDDTHPIDIVQAVATRHAWQFDRLADDQIAMQLEGRWRRYALTLAWSGQAEMLRLACGFDMDPPEARRDTVHRVMNLANELVWDGAFVHWAAERQMVWRAGLVLGGQAVALPGQVDRMIAHAFDACERFYPAFQLAGWGEATPREAMGVAMGAPLGRA